MNVVLEDGSISCWGCRKKAGGVNLSPSGISRTELPVGKGGSGRNHIRNTIVTVARVCIPGS